MVSFSRLLDQATSDTLIDINWGKNMEIIDHVRQGDITGKECVKQIKKRMFNRNPVVVIYTLTLLEAIVKNCGGPVQAEIATKDFMDQFRRLVRGSTPTVKVKCLDMIQTWAHAFEQNPKYRIVPDTYNILRVEGHDFPAMNMESDAMFIAETAPEWADGSDCYSCRTRFTLTNRKHHCRRCGQLFCQKCSNKKSTIPKFGIERLVRVCDNCHDILQGNSEEGSQADPMTHAGGGAASLSSGALGSTAAAAGETLTPEQEVAKFIEMERQAAMASAAPAASSSGSGSGSGSLSAKEQEQREQEEFELALALSMSEAESGPAAGRQQSMSSAYSSASAPSQATPQATPKRGMYDAHSEALDAASTDPMAAYMRSQSGGQQQQAGGAHTPERGYNHTPEPDEIVVPLSTAEDQEFIRSMANGVGLFEQKLARAKKRGGGVSSDTALQGIFRSLAVMHPELISRIDNLEDERSTYDALKEKLGQIQAAGEKLKEVQAEQQAKLEQQRHEQAMLEKIQLEQKMKLLEQQAREQKMMQRAMDERLRLQQEETRRQDEARALAAQEKAVRMEQERLAAQQAELFRRRGEAQAAQQAIAQHHSAQRLNQMHMQAESERSRTMASQQLAAENMPYGQYAPMPAMGGPAMAPSGMAMPVPPQRDMPPRGPPLQQQYAPPPQGMLPQGMPPQQQQQQQQQHYASPQGINQPPQPPGNMNRPPQPGSGSIPYQMTQGQYHHQQQQQQQQQQQPRAPPGQPPMQQGYGMPPQQQQQQQQQMPPPGQQQQYNGQPPMASQHQAPAPRKADPEPLISFD